MPRLIIIDDDRTSAEALERNLRVRSREQARGEWDILVVAPDPDAPTAEPFWERAVEAIRAAPPGRRYDLVLTDLCLPNVDAGYKVLERVKEIDPGVMTILYTGRPNLDRIRAYEQNVFAIVDRVNRRADKAAGFGEELYHLALAALGFRDQQRQVGELARFTDPHVGKAMLHDRASLNPTRRTLTVAFWDIRGFSAITRQVITHPELLTEFIAAYARLAREVIAAHNGILDKFIGDGVMALFGHPLKGSTAHDGACDAVTAALDLDERFNRIAPDWQEQFTMHSDTPVATPRLGCGINTDEVIVGYIGTDRGGEFTALGHGVNLAARVQDVARDPQRRILVTQRVEKRVKLCSGWSEWCRIEKLPEPVELHNLKGEHVLFSVTRPDRR